MPMGLAPALTMPGYGLTETTLVATRHLRNTPVKTFAPDPASHGFEQVVRYVRPKAQTRPSSPARASPSSIAKSALPTDIRQASPADHRVGVVETAGATTSS